jgi:hypothetical protein
MLFTSQFTAVFVLVVETEAVIVMVEPTATVAVVKLSVTVVGVVLEELPPQPATSTHSMASHAIPCIQRFIPLPPSNFLFCRRTIPPIPSLTRPLKSPAHRKPQCLQGIYVAELRRNLFVHLGQNLIFKHARRQ